MAKKLSALEKAIASIDAKIQALQAARTVLVEQQASQPKRKPRQKADAPLNYDTVEDPRR